MSKDNAGYVYVLSNKAMPGILKIGRSIHSGSTRAKEIYKQGGTGVPLPFDMEFEVWSDNCVEDELMVHFCFQNQRINSQREFFSVSVIDAIKTVLNIVCIRKKLHVDRSDSLILADDMVQVCDDKTIKFINDSFPGESVESVLSSAISMHMEIDDIFKIIKKHIEFRCFVRNRFNEKHNQHFCDVVH